MNVSSITVNGSFGQNLRRGRSVELLHFRENLIRAWSVRESRRAALVTYDSVAIDDKGRRPIADFHVDAHLKCDAVGRADRLCRICEQGEQHVIVLKIDLLEKMLGWPRFVRVDGHELGIRLFQVGNPPAQLRELAVAHRSRVAIDEHKHDVLLAPVVA